MKLPFLIVSRENQEQLQDCLCDYKAKCDALEHALERKQQTIDRMQCGDLVCGGHCESCKNAFVRIEKTARGNVVDYHCKLKAANTCKSYQPVDPA